MNSGLNTAPAGFRTRYHITPVDSITGEPTEPTTTIDNMVLAVGYLALGNPTAFSHLSIGTNTAPASPQQTGLLTPISQKPISESTFSQTINEASGVVFSTCAYEFLFKDFTFPSNLKTIDLAEIGFDGVTRAVFTPVEVKRNNWVKVIAEVIYEYTPGATVLVEWEAHGGSATRTLKVEQSAFIFNQNPNNNTGRGWGADRSVRGYVWSGTEGDYNPTAIGERYVTATLKASEFHWEFALDVNNAEKDTTLPGIVIRDTVNGGAFLVRLLDGDNPFTIPEDGSVNLKFKFSWYQPAARKNMVG